MQLPQDLLLRVFAKNVKKKNRMAGTKNSSHGLERKKKQIVDENKCS